MAVVADSVYFTHERVARKGFTLNGVNMNVPVGCIYGLLGPSGCGKTTLLKCVIGLLRPSVGNISLFGYKAGDIRSGVPGSGIGYMPQELAIQYDLTIEEILTYFGRLHFMQSEHLSNEIDFLVKILDLSDKTKLIGELSGGQKRRVSLAISMLHKPRLLILDEPTVGVDPILSEVIWKLLLTISSTLKTTIIITTHYIDETKRANCVGFMRRGLILEENSPKTLLRKYEVKCLDDVFLKLCVEQKQSRKSSDNSPTEYKRTCIYNSHVNCVKLPYPPSELSSRKKFFTVLYTIIWKYLIETRRNPYAILTTLIVVISIVFAVKVVIGQTPYSVPVAWVVDEPFNHSYHVNLSQSSFEVKHESYLIDLNSSLTTINYGEIEETTTIEVIDERYEELYLPNILKNTINGKIIKLVQYSNFSSALKDAKRQIVRGIIHLKSNFSSSYLDCDPVFAEVEEYVSNDVIDRGSIHIYLDYANLVIAQTIRAVVFAAVQPFRKEIGAYLKVNHNLLSLPIVLQPINFEEDNPISSIEDIFSVATFITPGIVAFNSFALCVGLCILSLLVPIECDMYVRDYSAGVKPVHKVLGQIIARFIFMFFNAILNLLCMIYILDVPCRGSVVLIMILMWMQMLMGLSFGVFMSSSMSSSYFSLYTAISVTMILLASNGVIWDIECQPYYTEWMMRYSPLYYSAKSLRSMLIFSNASFHLVWPGFAFTAFWTALTFFGTVQVLSMKK